MNTRPEFANISENLYIGQGVQVHLSNPLISQIGTPAWNANDFVYGVTRLSDKAKRAKKFTILCSPKRRLKRINEGGR